MFMNLSTQYLGFALPNPFLVGASPLVYDLDTVKQLEDAGAAAIIMHSLFEEQIVRENIRGFPNFEDADKGIYPESSRFPLHPEAYLEHIQKLKESVDLPIFASLNGVHMGTWIEYAKLIEAAGADALELNLYFTPRSDSDTSNAIEKAALNIVKAVRESIHLPMAVKLTPFYTGLPRFVNRLHEAGARAAVLFNSFFQTDIDIESVSYRPHLPLSEPHALLMRTRWIATLHGRVPLDLCLSGGVHSHEDAVKAFMAGATTVQIVSSLLIKGPQFLSGFLEDFEAWMESHGYEEIDQLRGLLGFQNSSNTEALARGAYLRMLQSWNGEDLESH
jgi:dihydroorotate dehydrogenase (fumarate)